ncbi:MAG: tellurite resistance TerB family protein [Thermoanaerobaculia bacterium]
MIDAERMLGSLVRNAMSGGGRSRKRKRRRRRRGSILGTAGKGALAMGALGVAIAAYEHFTNQPKPGSEFGGGAAGSPPVPPSQPGSGASVTPPPPPPPPPSGMKEPQTPADSKPDEALLLVRAMIAAANADHEVDEQEKGRILEALDASGLGGEERQFILAELEAPIGPGALASQARTPELVRQVYLASLMAVDVDTAAEQNYLTRLAERLGLDDADVAELENMLEADRSGGPA